LHRAVWVWNTREITSDADQREKLLDFVEAQGFDRVFLQLVPADGQVARAGWVPFDADRMGELVALLKSRGASVYALDGDPSYALPENHAGVLRTVSAILEHNRTAPAERSFDGVRYDIEPYLLPSFRGDGRDALLAGYVELVSAVASTARGSLRVGLDVPFWLDAPEPSTGEPISATWRGDRRPILDHLVRLVDDVAVMAYRTSAYGMDGSLSQAHGELRAASAAGADVYIGLETEQLPDEDAYGFQGAPQPGPPSVGGPWIVMAPLSERVARVWLVPPGAESSLAALLAEAGALPEQVVHWRADPPAHIAAERQSFQRLGWERLRTEADRIARALRGSPAFAGVAYHHYGSLLKLLPSGGGR
jgi:hypothetical protein